MPFANHISSICQKSSIHISALCNIRNCSPENDAKTVAIRFSAGLLQLTVLRSFHNQHEYATTHPKHVTIAHVVTGINRAQHITPFLQLLHWRPIQPRIAIITFKIPKTGTPAYLDDLLQLSIPHSPVSYTHLTLPTNREV